MPSFIIKKVPDFKVSECMIFIFFIQHNLIVCCCFSCLTFLCAKLKNFIDDMMKNLIDDMMEYLIEDMILRYLLIVFHAHACFVFFW